MAPDDPRREDTDEPEVPAPHAAAPGAEGEPEPAPEAGPEAEAGDEPGAEPTPRGASDRPPLGLDVIYPDDPDDDEDEDADDLDEDDYEDDVRTVLITGASGNIGRKLRAAWEDVYDLVLVDQTAEPHDPDVLVADLAVMDEGWITYFHGVDTVVHLAANPNEFASWEELQGPNLDALANVLNACALAEVERVVFASSNHAMGGYRELGDMPITVDLPPRPDGPYGTTKLMGERLGVSLARAFDLTFVALRLGWNQAGENRPETLPDDWARQMWVSNRDLVGLFEAAVEADLGDRTSLVANGMSANRGSRWDLSETTEVLGYVPKDDAFADEA